MNLKFYSQFHPRSRRNPNRGSVLHRQQTPSAFQTGNWREAVPQSCPLHLLWQRNLAHSEWPTDSPDPDTYNLKKQTQTTFGVKSSRKKITLSCHTRGLKSRHVKLIFKYIFIIIIIWLFEPWNCLKLSYWNAVTFLSGWNSSNLLNYSCRCFHISDIKDSGTIS